MRSAGLPTSRSGPGTADCDGPAAAWAKSPARTMTSFSGWTYFARVGLNVLRRQASPSSRAGRPRTSACGRGTGRATSMPATAAVVGQADLDLLPVALPGIVELLRGTPSLRRRVDFLVGAGDRAFGVLRGANAERHETSRRGRAIRPTAIEPQPYASPSFCRMRLTSREFEPAPSTTFAITRRRVIRHRRRGSPAAGRASPSRWSCPASR